MRPLSPEPERHLSHTDIAAIDASARRHASRCGQGEMVWRVWGDGKPLLLLHGGHGSWSHWARNIESLAASRTVIAPDMPGFGESAMPPVPYSEESIATILAAGLNAIVGAEAAVDAVGFSFGGTIAGPLARHAGGRVQRLVLVGTGGLGLPFAPMPKMANWRRAGDEAERREALRQNLAILMIHDAANIDAPALQLHARNAARTRLRSKGISRSDTLARCLPHVPARLAAVWGEHDATVGHAFDSRRRLLEALQPGARVEIIADAGHWVQYEAAERFNRTLVDLLKE